MIAALVYSIIGITAGILAYVTYFRGNRKRSTLDLGIKPFFAEREPISESAPKRSITVDMSPVSGACSTCGESITLPFKCKFCGGLFCSEHRLPENHKCNGLR